jgi:hypothetical protein
MSLWTAFAPFAAQVLTPPADESLPIPDGDGAWSFRVQTTGGFDGQGRGNVTLSSIGDLTCTLRGRSCGAKVTPGVLQSFLQVLGSVEGSMWATPAAILAPCSDCYITTVTFSRREAGNVQVVRLTWNDVMRGRMPPEVIRLTDMAFSFADASSTKD